MQNVNLKKKMVIQQISYFGPTKYHFMKYNGRKLLGTYFIAKPANVEH